MIFFLLSLIFAYSLPPSSLTFDLQLLSSPSEQLSISSVPQRASLLLLFLSSLFSLYTKRVKSNGFIISSLSKQNNRQSKCKQIRQWVMSCQDKWVKKNKSWLTININLAEFIQSCSLTKASHVSFPLKICVPRRNTLMDMTEWSFISFSN